MSNIKTNILKTEQVLSRFQSFLEGCWAKEPTDIKNLRLHSLPPMGNLPCVLYANFNTFWMGENVQVLRLLALEQKVELSQLNLTMGSLLARHAARLSKWNLKETVVLVEELSTYFIEQGPQTYEDFIKVSEAFMVSMDRFNSWIDAMIPWNELDKKLELRPSLL